MLEISETDIIKSLRRDNPWWGGHETPPPFLHKRAYFQSFAALSLNWDVHRAVILMGPRRVGKTVMLLQLVHQALSAGLSQRHVLMASIDTPLYSHLPLERLLDLHAMETGIDPTDRRLIIFDEVQYLKNWEVHLKVLTDRYPNTRFIASGSAAAALRLKSQESGAGRFTEFFLPPLTFAEFLQFRELEDSLIQAQPDTVYGFSTPDIEGLNAAFVDYLNYGGYPEAVLNPAIRNDAQRYLGRDIIDKVLLRDLPSLYGIQDIQELNRLFTTLAYHSGQEINLEGLSTRSGVAKNTISRYLEYLEAAFLITRIRRIDDTGRTFQRMRQFKVYLTNPSMRAALFAPLDDTDTAIGSMVETAAFSQWFHSGQTENLHYARWKNGRSDREVDIVYVSKALLTPYWASEIKWSDRWLKNADEMVALIEFAQKNPNLQNPTVTTRSETGQLNLMGVTINYLPSALYCYAIGRNLNGMGALARGVKSATLP